MFHPRLSGRVFRPLALLWLVVSVGAAHAFVRGKNFPTEATPDVLHLRGQTYSVGTQRPPYNDLRWEIEDGRLTVRSGDAFHRFDDFEVVAFDVGTDLVTLFDRGGETFAISKFLLSGVVFEAPVPVALAEVSHGALEGERAEYEVVANAEAVVRELRARDVDPLVLEPGYRGLAGDLLLIRVAGGRREIVREVARAQVFEELGAVAEYIEYVTDLNLPSGNPRRGAGATDRFRRPERNADLPWGAVEAMQLLGRDTLLRLGIDRKYWARQGQRTRDVFDLEGRPTIEMPPQWKLRRRLGKRDMLALSAASLGGAALAAAASRQVLRPEFIAVVHATFLNWMGLIAPVWLDSRLRAGLVRMAVSMSLLPPVAWACYWVVDRAITKNGNAFVTQVQLGMRAIAQINEPFWKRLAQALRQPHLVRALSLGLNPWATVEPDSALGRAAGLEAPVRSGWMSTRAARGPIARVLKAVENQQDNHHSFAHWLALRVVGNEERLDPATLTLLMESEEPGAEHALLYGREGNRRRVQLAHALMKELRSGQSLFGESTLTTSDLETALAHARRVATELRKRPGWRQRLDELGYEWNDFKRRARGGLQTYAEADNRYWRTAMPTREMGEQNRDMQIPDYYGGGAFAMSIGPRANPLDPAALMVDPTSLTGASQQALYGFADAQRWYMSNNPANMTRIYADDESNNTEFDAREATLLRPRYRGPGLARGAGWWLKDFFNPSRGRYGETILENLRVSTQTIQAAFLLTVLSRVVFAKAPFVESAFAFFLNLIAGHLWYGLAWDFIVPTNQRMAARYAEYRRRTEAATGKIARALRLNDPAMWEAGMKDAAALFADPAARATPELNRKAREIEVAMAGSQSFADAEAFMWEVLENPPLPGKEPKWIRRTSSIVGTVIQTYLGLKLDVLTFRPDLNWGLLLLKATLGAAAVYTTVALVTKGWRYYQEKTERECQRELLYERTPGLAPGLAR